MKINKRLIFKILVVFIVFIVFIAFKHKECKKDKSSSIMSVESKPLIFYADLNGDGKDEKITMINKYMPYTMSSLKIIINDEHGRLLFNYTLRSKKCYDYGGEYNIQIFRYVSPIMKDTYRDLVFIYAGSTPPVLYILYCQPRQYMEGHIVIEDEKYDVLDTGIELEEFAG